MKAYIATFLFISIILSGPLRADGNHQHFGENNKEKLGQVNFPISCTQVAQEQFNLAVAMLHSFWYDEAEVTFRRVTAIDPTCAMGYWGIAMSLYHQLWATPPAAAELLKGRDALYQTNNLTIKSKKEEAYLNAIKILYDDKADYEAKKLAYQHAMEKLWVQNPDDREAAVFFALALISNASPKDKTYVNQKKALEVLQKVLQDEPNHPGVAHYIIHSSDYPELAKFGLNAARVYTHIAPGVPHALHMPSHIFIRLGQWQDAAQSNLAAYLAAKEYSRRNAIVRTWDQQFHFMDYMIYSYLQTGEADKAREIVQELQTIKKAQPENTTSAYAFAAIPARYAIERKEWLEASELTVTPRDFPWSQFGWCEAITHFARGLGAAKSKRMETAKISLQRLETLRDVDIAAKKFYTADQIEIQRLAVAAWIAYQEGKIIDALQLMRMSAELESGTEKDNVTPGAIIPARQLLGELLLELQQYDEALKELELSLIRTPNRRNGLYLAAQAAMLAGDQSKANRFEMQYKQLKNVNN